MRSSLILLSFATFISVVTNCFGAKSKEKEVIFFPYRSLTLEDREQTVYLPEGFFVILTSNSAIQSAIVGPMCPGIMVTAYEAEKDKAIVILAKPKSKPRNIARIIAEELGSTIDYLFIYSRDSEVHIREANPTFTDEQVQEEIKVLIEERRTISSAEQQACFCNLKNFLETKFCLDRSQVKAIYNDIKNVTELESRKLAASSVFIQKNELRNPYALCQITERIFAAEDETPKPLMFDAETLEKNDVARQRIAARLQEAAQKACRQEHGVSLPKEKYIRIPDGLAGLTTMTSFLHEQK